MHRNTQLITDQAQLFEQVASFETVTVGTIVTLLMTMKYTMTSLLLPSPRARLFEPRR